jgi:hypothetical protein
LMFELPEVELVHVWWQSKRYELATTQSRVPSPAGAARRRRGLCWRKRRLARRGLGLRYFGTGTGSPWQWCVCTHCCACVVFSMPRGDSKFLGGLPNRGGRLNAQDAPHPLHPQIATVFGAQLGHTARTPRQALRPGRQADPRPGADTLARKALSGDDSKGVPACEHPAGHDDSSQGYGPGFSGGRRSALWTLPCVLSSRVQVTIVVNRTSLRASDDAVACVAENCLSPPTIAAGGTGTSTSSLRRSKDSPFLGHRLGRCSLKAGAWRCRGAVEGLNLDVLGTSRRLAGCRYPKVSVLCLCGKGTPRRGPICLCMQVQEPFTRWSRLDRVRVATCVATRGQQQACWAVLRQDGRVSIPRAEQSTGRTGRGPGLAGLWPIREGRDPVERRLVWDRDARISSRAPRKPPRTGQTTGRAMPADSDVRMTRWPAGGGPVLCSAPACLPVVGVACVRCSAVSSSSDVSVVFLMPMLRVTRRMTSHSARTCIACLGSATQQDGCAMAEASDNLEVE